MKADAPGRNTTLDQEIDGCPQVAPFQAAKTDALASRSAVSTEIEEQDIEAGPDVGSGEIRGRAGPRIGIDAMNQDDGTIASC
jgi:hypothetical protein